MLSRVFGILLLLSWPAPAAAEWHIKPFLGVTFGGNTTFLDFEQAAGKANFVMGVNGTLLGEVLGLEADFSRAPGFFQSGGQQLVLSSTVTTLTGSVVFALPKRVFQYTLRPYFIAGTGMMHTHIDGRFGTFQVSSTLPAIDLGGGATGFLTDRLGLSWDVRRFESFGGKGRLNGESLGDEQLAFWRATMAVAIRY